MFRDSYGRPLTATTATGELFEFVLKPPAPPVLPHG